MQENTRIDGNYFIKSILLTENARQMMDKFRIMHNFQNFINSIDYQNERENRSPMKTTFTLKLHITNYLHSTHRHLIIKEKKKKTTILKKAYSTHSN